MSRRPDKRKFRIAKLHTRDLDNCAKKKKYETEEEAQFEADIRYLNYYQCNLCKHYHLTQRNDNEKPKTYTF